jgi:hypothetical protein
MNKTNQQEVMKRVERMFAPDVSVRLNEKSEIQSYHAVSKPGAEFIARQSLLGMDYDYAIFLSDGLTFEA